VKTQFWHERWASGQLGFHQTEVNEKLVQYWSRLGLADDASVFVPLCGKSLDMVWLRSQGHPVIGVELSPIAIKEFFREAALSHLEEESDDDRDERARTFRHFSGSGYDLYCGDFFDLDAELLREVRGVYDRGALIALPDEMRARYAAKMIEILPAGTRILLMVVEYDTSRMSGPPHSVSPADAEALFGADFEVEVLETRGALDPGPRFRERGLDAWTEHVMLLTHRSRSARGA
jgi:thiopurine S-methyltransferase